MSIVLSRKKIHALTLAIDIALRHSHVVDWLDVDIELGIA